MMHILTKVYLKLFRLLLFSGMCGLSGCNAPEPAITIPADPWTPELLNLFDRGKAIVQTSPDSAIIYFQKLEKRSREIEFNDGIGLALMNRGLIATNTGNSEQGIIFYQEALPYCLKARFSVTALPTLYMNMGVYYCFRGNYSSASQYYYKALQYSLQHIPDNEIVAVIYLNLSDMQLCLQQYEQCLYYVEQGEQFIFNHKATASARAGILNNKGEAYMALHRFGEAYVSLQKGLAIAREEKSCFWQQCILISLGKLMLKQDKNPEAVIYLKNAMQVTTTNPFYAFILPGYKLGIAYYRLKEYNSAEQILRQTLQKAEETAQQDESMEAHATLASVYQATGKYKNAFDEQQIVLQLKDSMMNKEKVNAINEMEVKYKTVQKDKDIAEKKLQISQQKNKLNQKNIWISGISFGALLLAIILFNRNRINKQKRQSQERQIHILQQQQDLLQQEAEINHLKDVMQGEEKERIRIARDLHDGIVSQLMAVRLHFTSALQRAAPHIPDRTAFDHTLNYLEEATKELRVTAHNLMPESVLQGGLIVALHTYCNKMSDTDGTKVHFQHYGHYRRRDPDTELSLYRIIQELVQNARKHAQAKHILVELNEEEDILSLMVEDDGRGCSQEDIVSAQGMGLKSIYTRVKAQKGTIHISGTPGVGTTINLEFSRLAAS